MVVSSFAIATRAFKAGTEASLERTDRDIPVMSILIGVTLSALGAAVFFGSLGPSPGVLAIGLLMMLVFSFFFASVAANAIATTARNPVSGMTMLTIIVSSVVLLQFGLSGATGMFFVMAIAGMVCTALAVSGQMITDLKTGYWLGSTPAAQEKVNLSIATGGTGGVFYPYGGGIAKIITDNLPNVEATAEVTAASVDNLKFLRDRKADLAFTTGDGEAAAGAMCAALAEHGVAARPLTLAIDEDGARQVAG